MFTKSTAFQEYLQETQAQITKAKSNIHICEPIHSQPSLREDIVNAVSLAVTSLERGQIGKDVVASNLARPVRAVPLGRLERVDYAFSTFELARMLRVKPNELAEKITSYIEDDRFISDNVGPYVNIQINNHALAQEITKVLSGPQVYGRSTDNAGKVVVVDYSSPNIAKPFGVNHLRSTVIGESIARLLEATGYSVIRDNHLGDWGTQFGNLLAAHRLFAPDVAFTSLSLDQLNRLYVSFSNEKKQDIGLARLGQEEFMRLEQGDEESLLKWHYASKLSLKEFDRIYQKLNVTFDTYVGEAYFVEHASDAVEYVKEKAPDKVKSDPETGAVYIDAEHPIVLRTNDGYCVYAARDLAAIEQRVRDFRPEAILYVVGEEQSTAFRGVFDIAHQAGLDCIEGLRTKLEHIKFGLLLDATGKKLSSRKGTSGKLEDVILEVERQALYEVNSRNQGKDEKSLREAARRLAVGAIVWNDLRTDRQSNVKFDMEKMLKLGSGTVVDIFYSLVRSKSILKQAANNQLLDIDLCISDSSEAALIATIQGFEEAISEAASERTPHLLVSYLQKLAQLHGAYYEKCRVVGITDENIKNTRIAIHRVYVTVAEAGLELLNIKSPDFL